jgi:hypothetical protein
MDKRNEARLRKMNTATTDDNKVAVRKLRAEYNPEEVQRYFEHCGWRFERRVSGRTSKGAKLS